MYSEMIKTLNDEEIEIIDHENEYEEPSNYDVEKDEDIEESINKMIKIEEGYCGYTYLDETLTKKFYHTKYRNILFEVDNLGSKHTTLINIHKYISTIIKFTNFIKYEDFDKLSILKKEYQTKLNELDILEQDITKSAKSAVKQYNELNFCIINNTELDCKYRDKSNEAMKKINIKVRNIEDYIKKLRIFNYIDEIDKMINIGKKDMKEKFIMKGSYDFESTLCLHFNVSYAGSKPTILLSNDENGEIYYYHDTHITGDDKKKLILLDNLRKQYNQEEIYLIAFTGKIYGRRSEFIIYSDDTLKSKFKNYHSSLRKLDEFPNIYYGYFDRKLEQYA